jgi:hypothetical protein
MKILKHPCNNAPPLGYSSPSRIACKIISLFKMNTQEVDEEDFSAVPLIEIRLKSWFDSVKQYARVKKLSDEIMEQLKPQILEDMPVVDDYLRNENKKKIKRCLLEGVSEWKDIFERTNGLLVKNLGKNELQI